MRLENKVAVITGAASGIGRACCIIFAREGARIVGADVDEAGGTETVDAVNANGGSAIFVRTDVSMAADTEHMAAETMRAFGAVHILVNNAGIIRAGTVMDTPEEVWDAVLDVNLKGLYLCGKYVIPHMIKSGGGSIINTSSAAGLVGAANQAAYDAAKGGAVNLSRQMALDFAQYNIRVNCLVPGGIDTPQSRNFIALRPNVKLIDAQKNWGALKRFGTAEEVANVALFLASDESSFVTGAPIIVDGGYLAE